MAWPDSVVSIYSSRLNILQTFAHFQGWGDEAGLIQSDGPFYFYKKRRSGDVLKAKKKSKY